MTIPQLFNIKLIPYQVSKFVTSLVRDGDNLLPFSIEQEAQQDAEIKDEDF